MKIVEHTSHILARNEAEELMRNPERDIKELLDKCKEKKEELASLGLKPFEIYNVLNIQPASLVVLQTILEDMLERFTEGQLNRILSCVKQLQ